MAVTIWKQQTAKQLEAPLDARQFSPALGGPRLLLPTFRWAHNLQELAMDYIILSTRCSSGLENLPISLDIFLYTDLLCC